MTRSRAKGRSDPTAIPKQAAPENKQTLVHQSYQGPIPPSLELQRYEEVLPGAAERIISMAEKEQAQRHGREDKETAANINLAHKGQWIHSLGMVFAFVISIACIWASVQFAKTSPWLAGIVFTSVISVLALAFIYDRKGRSS